MRCLRGHQRHGAFSCRWLRAAGLLCNSLGVTVSSTKPTQKKRNNAASARLLAAKRLRAAVVACGAVGAGAARGAATKAVKSAPGTIYRRGSCHPEADFFIARGQWLAPRPQPLQRSTAPVKKSERAILSPFRVSRRRHRHGTPEALNSPSPSAAASLEKLRAEVGSKATGETLKLSRAAVEAL